MGCNSSPMISGSTKYKAPVRIGNWYEELCIKDLELQSFKKQRDNRQLMVEKAHGMFGKLLKEITLTPPKGYVHFNSVFQIGPLKISIADMDTSRLNPVLSLLVSDQSVFKGDSLGEECEVVVSHSVVPCVRNAFRIVSCDSQLDEYHTLKFGQKFRMQCLDCGEDPLYLYSAPKKSNLSLSVSSSRITKVRGEDTLSLGVVRGSNCGADCDVPLAFTYWYCIHIDPLKRFETEDDPVPSNKPLVIVHMATNRNLAVENSYVDTLFGTEFMACVQNYRDNFKRETWKNVWTINNR